MCSNVTKKNKIKIRYGFFKSIVQIQGVKAKSMDLYYISSYIIKMRTLRLYTQYNIHIL